MLDPAYVRLVLNQNFEDAKARLLEPLLAIHKAHLVMLVEQGIVPRGDAPAIASALRSIAPDEVRAAVFDGVDEDLFFHVERLIARACGEETAGRLHTARSRNDIDMTMYRMQQRQMILVLVNEASSLRRSLLEQASAHRDTVFAAHTHTQPAQASTVAHYLMAVVEQLERDHVRLRAAFAGTNCNPLGACAITGTGFPIDRQRTTELLGFDAATGNTYGSIATVDYLLESVSAAAVLLAGLGRVIQDFLLWCTAEVGYLRLADGFVQTSSIMPQKRNPVALEHARALASLALGQAQAIVTAVHNTPVGDIVDSEDDLQPLVATMFRDAARAAGLVAAAMCGASFDRERMAERARLGWITATELADTLTREHGVAFKASHRVAAAFIAEATKRPSESHAVLLEEVTRSVLRRAIRLDDERLKEVLSPEYFVRIRTTPGGPAPAQIEGAISSSRTRLVEDEDWLRSTERKLRESETRLEQALASL
jgi:argininosuccinate lyase